MQRCFLFAVLACAVPAASAADVYKWTDAGGVVHYSDTEPAADVKASKLHLRGTTATESDLTTAAGNADQATGAAAAADTRPPAGMQVSAGPNAGRICEQARSELELLQSGAAVGLDTRGTGNPVPLDDNARQAQIARAQALIARYCK